MHINNQKHLPVFMSFVVFGLVGLFNFYDYFLQVAPGVFAKNLKQSFSIDASELGLLSAWYYLSYTVMQIPAGLLYDKFGGKKVVFFAVLTASLGALFFGMSENFFWASVSRLLIGGGSAFAFLGGLYFALRWFPERYFATLAGIVMLIASVGAVFGDAMLSYLIQDFGWRHTMIYIAIAGCALTLSILLFTKNHPSNDEILTQKETKASLMSEFAYLFSHKQIWGLSFYAFLSWSTASVFAVLWGIPFLKRADNMSLTEASFAISILWIGIGIGSPLMGFFSDYIKRRKLPLVLCALCATVLFCILLWVPHLSKLAIDSILFCLGICAAGVTIVFAAAKDSIPVEVQNLSNGVINMMAILSGLVLQPLIGYIMQWLWRGHILEGIIVYEPATYRYALMVMPFASALSLFIALFWIKETHCEDVS